MATSGAMSVALPPSAAGSAATGVKSPGSSAQTARGASKSPPRGRLPGGKAAVRTTGQLVTTGVSKHGHKGHHHSRGRKHRRDGGGVAGKGQGGGATLSFAAPSQRYKDGQAVVRPSPSRSLGSLSDRIGDFRSRHDTDSLSPDAPDGSGARMSRARRRMVDELKPAPVLSAATAARLLSFAAGVKAKNAGSLLSPGANINPLATPSASVGGSPGGSGDAAARGANLATRLALAMAQKKKLQRGASDSTSLAGLAATVGAPRGTEASAADEAGEVAQRSDGGTARVASPGLGALLRAASAADFSPALGSTPRSVGSAGSGSLKRESSASRLLRVASSGSRGSPRVAPAPDGPPRRSKSPLKSLAAAAAAADPGILAAGGRDRGRGLTSMKGAALAVTAAQRFARPAALNMDPASQSRLQTYSDSEDVPPSPTTKERLNEAFAKMRQRVPEPRAPTPNEVRAVIDKVRKRIPDHPPKCCIVCIGATNLCMSETAYEYHLCMGHVTPKPGSTRIPCQWRVKRLFRKCGRSCLRGLDAFCVRWFGACYGGRAAWDAAKYRVFACLDDNLTMCQRKLCGRCTEQCCCLCRVGPCCRCHYVRWRCPRILWCLVCCDWCSPAYYECKAQYELGDTATDAQIETSLSVHPMYQGAGRLPDFLFYVRNHHPVLLQCFRHPKSPYRYVEAKLVLLMSILVALGNAALLVFVLEAECQHVTGQQQVYDACVQLSDPQFEWSLHVVSTLALGLILAAIANAMKFCVWCRCVALREEGSWIRDSWECCGRYTMCLAVPLVVMYALACVGYLLYFVAYDPDASLDISLWELGSVSLPLRPETVANVAVPVGISWGESLAAYWVLWFVPALAVFNRVWFRTWAQPLNRILHAEVTYARARGLNAADLYKDRRHRITTGEQPKAIVDAIAMTTDIVELDMSNPMARMARPTATKERPDAKYDDAVAVRMGATYVPAVPSWGDKLPDGVTAVPGAVPEPGRVTVRIRVLHARGLPARAGYYVVVRIGDMRLSTHSGRGPQRQIITPEPHWDEELTFEPGPAVVAHNNVFFTIRMLGAQSGYVDLPLRHLARGAGGEWWLPVSGLGKKRRKAELVISCEMSAQATKVAMRFTGVVEALTTHQYDDCYKSRKGAKEVPIDDGSKPVPKSKSEREGGDDASGGGDETTLASSDGAGYASESLEAGDDGQAYDDAMETEYGDGSYWQYEGIGAAAAASGDGEAKPARALSSLPSYDAAHDESDYAY